jgi:hypothetical protein
MDENHVERLAGVSVGALNDINLPNAAVTVGVGSEKLAKDALNVVFIVLVVDPREADRRKRDIIVG